MSYISRIYFILIKVIMLKLQASTFPGTGGYFVSGNWENETEQKLSFNFSIAAKPQNSSTFAKKFRDSRFSGFFYIQILLILFDLDIWVNTGLYCYFLGWFLKKFSIFRSCHFGGKYFLSKTWINHSGYAKFALGKPSIQSDFFSHLKCTPSQLLNNFFLSEGADE